MKVRIERPHLLAALKFQAKNDPRHYINGIFINKNGELATTDGHRLFVGKHNGAKESVLIQIKDKLPSKFEYADIDTESGFITYLNINEEPIAAGLCKEIDGRFPNYQQIIDKIKPIPTAQVAFRGVYVESVFSVAKYFGKLGSIKINLCGSGEAAKFDITDGAFVIIMPMNI